MRQNLISEIKEFLQETGLSAYRFGYLAVKNGRLVERLEAGRRIWPETETEVRAFMRSERRRREKGGEHRQATPVNSHDANTRRARDVLR